MELNFKQKKSKHEKTISSLHGINAYDSMQEKHHR
jgi:hypothetical protein